jgi:hypothetical protein
LEKNAMPIGKKPIGTGTRFPRKSRLKAAHPKVSLFAAPRSFDDGDRIAEGGEDLYLGPLLALDPNVEVEGGDHLQTIRDCATFAGEPVHLRLDVTAYPEDIHRVVLVVIDDVTLISRKSEAAPRKTLPLRSAGKFALRRRLKGREHDE